MGDEAKKFYSDEALTTEVESPEAGAVVYTAGDDGEAIKGTVDDDGEFTADEA